MNHVKAFENFVNLKSYFAGKLRQVKNHKVKIVKILRLIKTSNVHSKYIKGIFFLIDHQNCIL